MSIPSCGRMYPVIRYGSLSIQVLDIGAWVSKFEIWGHEYPSFRYWGMGINS